MCTQKSYLESLRELMSVSHFIEQSKRYPSEKSKSLEHFCHKSMSSRLQCCQCCQAQVYVRFVLDHLQITDLRRTFSLPLQTTVFNNSLLDLSPTAVAQQPKPNSRNYSRIAYKMCVLQLSRKTCMDRANFPSKIPIIGNATKQLNRL